MAQFVLIPAIKWYLGGAIIFMRVSRSILYESISVYYTFIYIYSVQSPERRCKNASTFEMCIWTLNTEQDTCFFHTTSRCPEWRRYFSFFFFDFCFLCLDFFTFIGTGMRGAISVTGLSVQGKYKTSFTTLLFVTKENERERENGQTAKQKKR